ncbi:hypothetical protein NM688_g6012 [Phlebia brevispora]|uniref:Uncharacterized protein n=1 Tax=Phlebia brevispora TaxID=194682 RepID=A0ACC1SL66_9APHY|nr:hypothetical protein NM688_g6012 [Phlebia brevispora]
MPKLRLPVELIWLILEHLPNGFEEDADRKAYISARRTLASCMLVSRAFAEYVRPIQWGSIHMTFTTSLNDSLEDGQPLVVANQWPPEGTWKSFHSIQRFFQDRPELAHLIRAFYLTALKVLVPIPGVVSESKLASLLRRFPNIQRLSLDNISIQCSHEAVAEERLVFPPLEHLNIACFGPFLFYRNALEVVSLFPKIEHVTVRSQSWNPGDTEDLFADPSELPHPAPAIRSLTTYFWSSSPAAAVRILVRAGALKDLVYLDVGLLTEANLRSLYIVAAAIAPQLRRLKHLAIWFYLPEDNIIPHAAFEMLSSLTQLEELSLNIFLDMPADSLCEVLEVIAAASTNLRAITLFLCYNSTHTDLHASLAVGGQVRRQIETVMMTQANFKPAPVPLADGRLDRCSPVRQNYGPFGNIGESWKRTMRFVAYGPIIAVFGNVQWPFTPKSTPLLRRQQRVCPTVNFRRADGQIDAWSPRPINCIKTPIYYVPGLVGSLHFTMITGPPRLPSELICIIIEHFNYLPAEPAGEPKRTRKFYRRIQRTLSACMRLSRAWADFVRPLYWHTLRFNIVGISEDDLEAGEFLKAKEGETRRKRWKTLQEIQQFFQDRPELLSKLHQLFLTGCKITTTRKGAHCLEKATTTVFEGQMSNLLQVFPGLCTLYLSNIRVRCSHTAADSCPLVFEWMPRLKIECEDGEMKYSDALDILSLFPRTIEVTLFMADGTEEINSGALSTYKSPHPMPRIEALSTGYPLNEVHRTYLSFQAVRVLIQAGACEDLKFLGIRLPANEYVPFLEIITPAMARSLKRLDIWLNVVPYDYNPALYAIMSTFTELEELYLDLVIEGPSHQPYGDLLDCVISSAPNLRSVFLAMYYFGLPPEFKSSLLDGGEERKRMESNLSKLGDFERASVPHRRLSREFRACLDSIEYCGQPIFYKCGPPLRIGEIEGGWIVRV